MPDAEVLRLLDANVNRAVEGIRLLEETARMIFNDQDLTRRIKEIRHSIVRIVNSNDTMGKSLLFARDSERDVLRTGEIPSEKDRADIAAMTKANASRAQEAVRVLEEFSKLVFPALSERFKDIRFQLYDIEKVLFSRIHREDLINRERLKLTVVIHRELSAECTLSDLARVVIRAGGKTVVYSDTVSSDEEMVKNASVLASAAYEMHATSLISGRVDIALAAEADGVWIRPHDIPVRTCRSIAGMHFVVGYSVSLDCQVSEVVDAGADVYVVGPVFREGRSRNSEEKLLENFVSQVSAPVVIHGSVGKDNLTRLLACGITGIVVKPEFSDMDGMIRELEQYRALLDR